jgi:hypothetical protein
VGQAPGGFRFQAAGGNPGGFLYLDNSETVEAGIGAPTQFHGDWSRFIGGTLTFDGNMLGIGGLQWGPFPTDYGNLTIGGPGGNMRADLAPGTHSSAGAGYPPINTWTTFSVAMDATSWGVSEATFNSILSNVSQITLSVEALFGNEVQGIDNVRVVGKAGVCSGP